MKMIEASAVREATKQEQEWYEDYLRTKDFEDYRKNKLENLSGMTDDEYNWAMVMLFERTEPKTTEACDFNNCFFCQRFSDSKKLLSTAVAMALESAGYENEHSIKTIGFSLRKISLFEANKNLLLQKLEEAGIWYMPLKGAVLKDFYPRLGMREMSDYDILFDASRAIDVKNIMENLGFTTNTFDSYNESGYIKPPLTFFEMHRTLFGARHKKTICDYYADVKTRLIKDNNNQYGFHFTKEDFYIYTIVHEYCHYTAAGTGLRSLLDTYVFLKKHELNWDYISIEISKLGISDFEKANRTLALNLFSGQKLTNEQEKMLNYILSSGTYGSIESIEKNANKKIAEYGRFKYFLKRLTLPYPQMLEEYPILKKAPFLYPLCWLSRLFIRGLFLRRKQFLSQLKAILSWNK